MLLVVIFLVLSLTLNLPLVVERTFVVWVALLNFGSTRLLLFVFTHSFGSTLNLPLVLAHTFGVWDVSLSFGSTRQLLLVIIHNFGSPSQVLGLPSIYPLF